MFLVLPIGNGIRLRVFPVTTTLLVLLNLSVAAWSLPKAERLRSERVRVERSLRNDGTRERRGVAMERAPHLRAVRQAALGARLAALEADDPIRSWAYGSGSPLLRAVSALFVHADLLHLLTNLLPLVLLGAFVEQAWGPLWTLLLYLTGGTCGLLLDAATGPPGLLLGASAAVATLLGAYCVRFRTQPIRFGYVYLECLRPRRGSFQVSCMALAGLWLAQQVVGLALQDPDAGVAFGSHLVGFALGAVAAALATEAKRASSPRGAPGPASP